MLNLPIELQDGIFDYLGRDDLLSLAQTCKSLSPVASARLRTIIPELDLSAFARCIRVLKADAVRAAEILELTISKYERKVEPPERPRRASFLATLKATICGSGAPPAVSPGQPTCNPPLGALDASTAFRNLTRLRKLVIHAPQSALLWAFPVVIETLREIYAHSGAESTPLLGWISYQPRLDSLRIHCNRNKLREYRVDPPTAIFFPRLSCLTTNPEGASTLLPESVVDDLHIEDLVEGAEPPRASEAITQPQRPSLVRAICESHARTKLRRLTLIGDSFVIFRCLKALAAEDLILPRIRIVLGNIGPLSIEFPVRLKVWRVLLDA